MGCDIHAFVEIKVNGIWEQSPILLWDLRSYSVFGWLADVRNYSAVGPQFPVKGIPTDVRRNTMGVIKDWDEDGHTHSWVTLKELLEVDYNQTVWNRRVTRQITPTFSDGGCTTDNPPEGERLPLSEFLGKHFMQDLKRLKELGEPENVRVVFFFDN